MASAQREARCSHCEQWPNLGQFPDGLKIPCISLRTAVSWRVGSRISDQEDGTLDTTGLDVIAEVAIGLAGFSGVFVALTQSGTIAPPERFRLQFLLYASLGAMFLAMLPHAVFARSWSPTAMWRLLGVLVTSYTALLVPFLFKAVSMRREYPELFTIRIISVQGSLMVVAVSFSVAVLVAPIEDKLSNYTGALLLLLAHATVVFIRLLFYRRSLPPGQLGRAD